MATKYSLQCNKKSHRSDVIPIEKHCSLLFQFIETRYRFSSLNESCRRVLANSSISFAFTWSKLVVCNLCKQEYALSCKWGTTTTEHTIYLLSKWLKWIEKFSETMIKWNKKRFCKCYLFDNCTMYIPFLQFIFYY